MGPMSACEIGTPTPAIVAITPHICVAELAAISPLPLIDIVSELAAAIQTLGLKRVTLLGTRFTVESRMFDRLGVDVTQPRTSRQLLKDCSISASPLSGSFATEASSPSRNQCPLCLQ